MVPVRNMIAHDYIKLNRQVFTPLYRIVVKIIVPNR